MNARTATVAAGVVTLLLGLAGLLYPERVIGILGLTLMRPTDPAAALGEVRATYGGIFLVLGLATLLAAANPAAQRGRLTLLGLVWLGACAARLFGVYVDGSPGLFGWLPAAFEVIMGGTLMIVAQASREVVEAPRQPVAPPAAPTPPA